MRPATCDLRPQTACVGAECDPSRPTCASHAPCGLQTTVKKSVVGKHCEVGNNVKLASSVLMDNIKIGDG